MKHILLVDDNITNLRMAASVLSPYYDLSMAKSGRQALSFLKKNKPDLILLDLLMPEMNGYETMEEIKLNPATQDIPIIFLTADNQRESEIKGLQLGALDFITKPFDEEVMLSRIEKVLLMEDMRRKLFDANDMDANSGLYTFDHIKSFFSEHLAADKGGAMMLISIDNMTELRENVSSKSFSSYMSYFYEILSDDSDIHITSCSVSDDTFLCVINDSIDIFELQQILDKYHRLLSKEIKGHEESYISNISIGCALCFGNGDFDYYYSRADKALYHAVNSEDIAYHIFKGK